MSIEEVGSMSISGYFRDISLLSTLRKIKTEIGDFGGGLKSVTNDMLRMTSRSKLLAIALSGIGIGGFAGFLGMMPRVNAQFKLAHAYVQQIALALDDNFAPAMELVNDGLEDFRDWFVKLPEPIQSVIGWLGILTGTTLVGLVLGLGSGTLSLGTFSGALTTLSGAVTGAIAWFSGLVASFSAFVAGSVAAQIVLGILVGLVSVLALDKVGFFEWISNMTQGFRDARDEGDLWAIALTALLTPIALLGSAILTLVTDRSWDDFKNDVEVAADNFRELKTAVSEFYNYVKTVKMPNWYGNVKELAGNYIHDVGTSNVTYTGWHWLKAGESVNMRGMEGNGGNGGNGKTVNITNTFGDIVLNNGMDMREFIGYISKEQASRTAWRER